MKRGGQGKGSYAIEALKKILKELRKYGGSSEEDRAQAMREALKVIGDKKLEEELMDMLISKKD